MLFMPSTRPKDSPLQFGRVEKAFLALLLLEIVLYFAAPRSGMQVLVSIAVFVLGIVAAIRLLRRASGRLIWRLRNRLIVAYVFIAVVPVLLIMVLVASATYVITGQVAVYLINSELERRNALLAGPARMLAVEPPAARAETVKRLLPFLRTRFPDIEVSVRDATAPPASEAGGFVVRDRHLYSWAHVTRQGTEVTLAAPVTHELLTGLIPGLGDVFVLTFPDLDQTGNSHPVRLDTVRDAQKDFTPPPFAAFDAQVTGASMVPVASWSSPTEKQAALLVVHTRTSAVLGIIFGQKFDVGQAAVLLFLAVAIAFFVFELVSLFIGISLTRTITGAVDNLYQGTQRVSQGDFSHRIAVRGKDQLAELGVSFNQMTANLERLIVVEKEKERLQSELEIAREVQSQLFPKNVPSMKALAVTGVCHPARMVSGDYYDFIALSESTLAVAIGDVAGKGISAALLMAAIQSTMRTQLSAGIPMAAAAGAPQNGRFSTARLVSQLNKQLYATTSPEKYATFYFAIYEAVKNTLRYTNAGHLPPLWFRDGNPSELEVTGTVVGAFPFSEYSEQEVTLAPGDLLVAYTDGVVEPENEYGEQFGLGRLTDLVVKYTAEDSNEIVARTRESVEQWTGSSELQDDMTMVLVRHL